MVAATAASPGGRPGHDPAKTVKGYHQILLDTLLGTLIETYTKRQERQVMTKAGKFYLFDVGVAGFITKCHIREERGEPFGRALEHFVLMEIPRTVPTRSCTTKSASGEPGVDSK